MEVGRSSSILVESLSFLDKDTEDGKSSLLKSLAKDKQKKYLQNSLSSVTLDNSDSYGMFTTLISWHGIIFHNPWPLHRSHFPEQYDF